MAKKILITGAAGFIGSHLVEYLLAQKIPVSSLRLLLSPWDTLDNLPKTNIEIVRADITKPNTLRKALRGVDIVYHLAALTVKPEYTDKDYMEVNTNGTINLINLAKEEKIEKFIFFSSVAVYGLPAYVGDMKNISEIAYKNPAEIYGKSKLEAEEALTNSKIPYVIIRPTTVYGPRDDHGLLELFRQVKKHHFFIIGNGKNRIDNVYVLDLVKGAYQAQKNRVNTDYILGGGATCLRDIGRDVSSATSSWIFPFHMPISFAYPLSYILQRIGKIFKIQVPLYPDRVRAMTSNFTFDFSKARSQLRYKPSTSFKKGCEITAEWVYHNDLL